MSGARLEDVVVNTINTRSAGKMHFLNSGRPSCLCWCGPNERPPHPNLLQFHPQIRPKSHILIMDNLSSHKSSRVLEKIHAVGVDVLFLPPYSPDLNPIAQISQRLKQACADSPQELSVNFTVRYPKRFVLLPPAIA